MRYWILILRPNHHKKLQEGLNRRCVLRDDIHKRQREQPKDVA